MTVFQGQQQNLFKRRNMSLSLLNHSTTKMIVKMPVLFTFVVRGKSYLLCLSIRKSLETLFESTDFQQWGASYLLIANFFCYIKYRWR